MRVISFVAIAFMLAGCATYRHAITLPDVGTPRSLVVSDDRPDEEKSWKDTPTARCSNRGRWTGIRDDAFEQSRVAFVAARLGAAFGDRISRVSLRHFQNCYQINSITNASALAGISVVLATIVDSMMKGEDHLLTYIEVAVDGKDYAATDTRTYVARDGVGYGFLEEQTVADIASSTEAAMAELIRKISADLKAPATSAVSGDDKTTH